MVVRIEHRVVGEHDAQHGDLHARDQRLEGARQLRVGEQRFEQPGGELDHLAIDRLAGARDQRGAVLFEALAAGRSASRCSDASDGRWRSSSSSRSSACSSSGLRRRAPSLRTARAPAPPSLAPSGTCRRRDRGRAVGGARHARQQGAERAGARRLRRRDAAEGRARRQDHGAVDARARTPCALEPRRRRRPGVLQQPGDHAGRGAQHDRALDLRGDDRAGRVPQRRWRRRAAETGSTRR